MVRRVLFASIATLAIATTLAACGPSAAPPAATPTTAATPPAAASPTMATASPTPAGTPAATAPPSPSAAGNVENGRAVYNTNCNACHPDGKQGVGPAITASSDQTIISVARNGRGAMPAFGPDRISDQQMQDMLAYVRTLR